MSTVVQLRVVSSNIHVVDLELLKDALRLAAERTQGEIRGEVQDRYGHSRSEWNGLRIVSSLHNSDFRSGVGVALNKEGILQFVGDRDCGKEGFDKVEKQIINAYLTILLLKAAKEKECDVTVEKLQGGIKLEVTR